MNEQRRRNTSQILKYYPITHGGIRRVFHPRLKVEINGQTTIRYLRFLRHVRVDRLELGFLSGLESAPGGGSGRWVPNVPTHPAHLIISVLDASNSRWRTVREVDLPPNPIIMGEGLSQEMTVEEMDVQFAKVLTQPPHVIDMAGLCTDHLRVECDREHPTWPNHGESNGGPFNVPFSILNPLVVFGEPEPELSSTPVYNPILRRGIIRPEAPKGMKVYDKPEMLLFEGKRFSVGFSLRRPVLMHLGWDAHSQDRAGQNRLLATRGGRSGPLVRTLTSDCGSHLWTGEVIVEGNRVIYHNLSGIEGLTIEAAFTVESDRLFLELMQHCDRELPVIEFEAWRLAWDIRMGITGAMAMPTLSPGRNGDVKLPMLWATDGVGCLSCRIQSKEENEPLLQVESYRFNNALTGGFSFGPRPGLDECMVLREGTRKATFEMFVTALSPMSNKNSSKLGPGVSSRWATPFAGFRPELGGFSDHSISVNCHMSQDSTIDLIVFTRKPRFGPDPIELARWTIGRALLDGGGYGYWRNLYMDTDPALVSSAGRIHQVRPDLNWLRHIEPGLIETVNRMLATIDKEGLVVCRDLSGDSGSYRWSTNLMDVVGFGHLDAYVNALSYRAFRNAAVLLADLDHQTLSSRCKEAAMGIHSAYTSTFVNPETGWVAGWRSRDGQLHDYAFTFVNGTAIAFGLLNELDARNALRGLEGLREKIGMGDARMGIPVNLLPIKPEDHMLPKVVGELTPTFENYTDGGLSGVVYYYLRALSIYGPHDKAHKLAQELDDGYANGIFDGGNSSGREFRSWEGMPNGYEGTLCPNFGVLYAIAIEQGVLTPPEPEWWPAGG